MPQNKIQAQDLTLLQFFLHFSKTEVIVHFHLEYIFLIRNIL